MPKFTDSEREIIESKLLLEGEQLFTVYGVKKVSVDDLVKAVGIAKGSFYAFYTSKEHLYMDILSNLQNELWKKIDSYLEKNSFLPPRELAKKAIQWALKEIENHPMLMQFDGELADYLFRKLPPEVIAEHTHDDSQALGKLLRFGVNFTCDLDIATKAIQIFAMTYFQFSDKDDKCSVAVMDLLLTGLINEIVSDEL